MNAAQNAAQESQKPLKMVAGGGIGWAMPAASHSKSSVYFIADGFNIKYPSFLSRSYSATTMDLLTDNGT